MTTYKVKQGTEIRSDRVEITRIEKVNFVSEVYRQLRQMIVSGTWEEGSKIAPCNMARFFFTFLGLELNDLLENKLFRYPKDERRAFYENPLEQPTF